MKIHDLLAQALASKQGKLLSYLEIQSTVLQAYPNLKPSSILPREHTGKTGPKACLLCQKRPLLARQGHGIYKVLSQSNFSPEKSTHDKLASVLQNHTGEIFTLAQIRTLVSQAFPDAHLPSILPSDHMLGGACRECSKTPLFGKTSKRGLYQVLAREPIAVIKTTVVPGNVSQPAAASSLPIPAIRQLLESYGYELLQAHPEGFITQMNQHLGKYRREINLLGTALRERIPFDLVEFASLGDYDDLFGRLCQRLERYQGLQPAVAEWAVATWGKILRQDALLEQHDSPPKHTAQSFALADQSTHLAHLAVYDHAAGYKTLKKGVRKLAVCYTDHPAGCMLGIKQELWVSELTALLTDIPQVTPQQIPGLIGLQKYLWFQPVALETVIAVFECLDQLF